MSCLIEHPTFASKETPIIHPYYKPYPLDKLFSETKMVLCTEGGTEFRKNPKRRGIRIWDSNSICAFIEMDERVMDSPLADEYKIKKLWYLPSDIFDKVVDYFQYEMKGVIFCDPFCEHYAYCDRTQCDMNRERAAGNP